MGDDIHAVSGKKFLGEKESARQCDVMMKQPVLLSPKFGGEVFTRFHAVTLKCHSSILNWLFGLPGFLCEQFP
jgi:hypothetical protein